MSCMPLAIIILNWNAAADTLNCVHAISAWKRLQPTLYVVDNNSADNSVELISREYPQIQLIRAKANLGFAGGNNLGIIQALTAGDAPIMLLNNDAEVAEADILCLLETLQADERIGFIGPCLYNAEKPDRLLSAGGKNPVLHHHSHIAAPPTTDPVYPVMYVPGTVIIIRAEVFRRVGLLDETYFFSTEVADLCMQGARHDYSSVIDTRARAYHTLSRSSKLRDTLYTYYIIRNRFIFLRKHYRWQIWLHLFWMLYSLALAVKLHLGAKRHTAQSVFLGLFDGLQGRFGGQNERVLAAVKPMPQAPLAKTHP